MKKKKIIKQLLKDVKVFIRFYVISLLVSGLLIETIDLYHYKDNIYYHDELKLSDKEMEEIEEKVSTTIGVPITKEDNAIVLDAVIENENLSKDEKEILYNYVDLLEDNPYLNKSNTYNNLEDLDIIYDKDADYGKDVMGVYDNTPNAITIIEESENQDTIHHELVHCIYSQNTYNRLPVFFNEGMTELLTNEYFAEDPFKEEVSYPYEITMVKMLCELVGEDVVLESYTKKDIKILENKLGEVTNLCNPHEFINYIDSVMTSLEKDKKVDEEKLSSIVDVFDRYYENYPEDSIEYKMYKYNTKTLKYLKYDNPYSVYKCSLMMYGYYAKPYFSEELKEKYKEPVLIDYYKGIEGKNDNKEYVKTYNIESV